MNLLRKLRELVERLERAVAELRLHRIGLERERLEQLAAVESLRLVAIGALPADILLKPEEKR